MLASSSRKMYGPAPPAHLKQNVYTRTSVARRKEAVDALEQTLPMTQFGSILEQALKTGDPKLPISWSGRRDSHRRRPAWESSFQLKIKNNGAHGDAYRSKEISNFYPIRPLLESFWRVRRSLHLFSI